MPGIHTTKKSKKNNNKDFAVDFYVKPHPNDSSVKTLEIYTSVPDELAEKLVGKTVSLSKSKGGCLFEIKDFAVHNDHMGLFHSEEELNKFITRVQIDVVQVLKDVGYSVNEISSVVPIETYGKNGVDTHEEDSIILSSNGLKIDDVVQVVEHGTKNFIDKKGIVIHFWKEPSTIGVDFGEEIKGLTHNLNGALPSKTGYYFLAYQLEKVASHTDATTTAEAKQEKVPDKFQLGNIVSHNQVECLTLSSGKLGIVKVVNNTQIGVDYGPGAKGHNLGGAIITNNGFWESPLSTCLKLIHPADENINYLEVCTDCQDWKFYNEYGVHFNHLISPKKKKKITSKKKKTDEVVIPKFKIGDKVKYNGEKCYIDCGTPMNLVGTLVIIDEIKAQSHGVAFDENFPGKHFIVKNKYNGWWMHKECLELVDDEASFSPLSI